MSLNWAMLVPVLLLLAPITLHVLEKTFELTKVLSEGAIENHLRSDDRDHVKTENIIANKDLFSAIKAFYAFETQVHFILSLVLFCVISLLITLIEKIVKHDENYCVEGDVILLLIVLLLGYAVTFLFIILRGGIRSNRHNPIRGWLNSSYLAVGITVLAEILLDLVA